MVLLCRGVWRPLCLPPPCARHPQQRRPPQQHLQQASRQRRQRLLLPPNGRALRTPWALQALLYFGRLCALDAQQPHRCVAPSARPQQPMLLRWSLGSVHGTA